MDDVFQHGELGLEPFGEFVDLACEGIVAFEQVGFISMLYQEFLMRAACCRAVPALLLASRYATNDSNARAARMHSLHRQFVGGWWPTLRELCVISG